MYTVSSIIVCGPLQILPEFFYFGTIGIQIRYEPDPMVNGSLHCNLFVNLHWHSCGRHLVCYTVLTRPNQVETAVYGCNPTLCCVQWCLAKSTFSRSQISPCSFLYIHPDEPCLNRGTQGGKFGKTVRMALYCLSALF